MEEQEVEENLNLPPRTSIRHLLSVEPSLEGIYVTPIGLQQSVDALTRKMEVVVAAHQNQENGRPYKKE